MTDKARNLGNEYVTDASFTSQKREGLTKREYFAALAMQSLISKSVSNSLIAKEAVDCADALLEELSKK